MPHERVTRSDPNGWADVLVRWTPRGAEVPGRGPEVDLFVVAPNDDPRRAGSYMFTPEHPEFFGGNPGDSMGPISIILDEGQIDRLIEVLKVAKRKTYNVIDDAGEGVHEFLVNKYGPVAAGAEFALTGGNGELIGKYAVPMDLPQVDPE